MYRLSKGYRETESNRVEYIRRETRRVEVQSSRNTEDIVKSPNKYRETEGTERRHGWRCFYNYRQSDSVEKYA